jgi:hypothetical protein
MALLDPNNPPDLSSLIDNALGGSGNDTIYTNDVANLLSGLGAGYAAVWMMDGTKNVSDANLGYLGTGWHLL